MSEPKPKRKMVNPTPAKNETLAKTYHADGLDDLKHALGELETARLSILKLAKVDIESIQRDIVRYIANETNSLDLKSVLPEISEAEILARKAYDCIGLCKNVTSKMAMDYLEQSRRKVEFAREKMDYAAGLRGETFQDIV